MKTLPCQDADSQGNHRRFPFCAPESPPRRTVIRSSNAFPSNVQFLFLSCPQEGSGKGWTLVFPAREAFGVNQGTGPTLRGPQNEGKSHEQDSHQRRRLQELGVVLGWSPHLGEQFFVFSR